MYKHKIHVTRKWQNILAANTTTKCLIRQYKINTNTKCIARKYNNANPLQVSSPIHVVFLSSCGVSIG